MLDTGNEKFIDVKYKGMFHFRDSIRQLSKSLEDLGPAFKVPTLKGTFPHKFLARPGAVFADRAVAFKPRRVDFEVNAKASEPLKHKRRTLLGRELQQLERDRERARRLLLEHEALDAGESGGGCHWQGGEKRG